MARTTYTITGGAGEQSGILLQGTNAQAARNLSLIAEDEVRLLAAKNTYEQHSTNQNSSASLGIGFMVRRNNGNNGVRHSWRYDKRNRLG